MCFSLGYLVQILIFLVVLCALIAIFRIWILPMLSSVDPRIPATINIIIWAVVCIFVIYVCADLLFCAMGSGPIFPRTR
jgi:hypothetical protein